MPQHGDIPITAYFSRQTSKNPGKRQRVARDDDDDAHPPPPKYVKVSSNTRQATATKVPKVKHVAHSKPAVSRIDLTQESQPAVVHTPRRPLVQLNNGLTTPHPFDDSLSKHLPTETPAVKRGKRVENIHALPTPVSLVRVGNNSKARLLASPGSPSVVPRPAKPIAADVQPLYPLLKRNDALFKRPLTPIHTSSLPPRDEIVPSSQSDELLDYFHTDEVKTSPVEDTWGDEIIASSQLHERESFQIAIPSSQPNEHYEDHMSPRKATRLFSPGVVPETQLLDFDHGKPEVSRQELDMVNWVSSPVQSLSYTQETEPDPDYYDIPPAVLSRPHLSPKKASLGTSSQQSQTQPDPDYYTATPWIPTRMASVGQFTETPQSSQLPSSQSAVPDIPSTPTSSTSTPSTQYSQSEEDRSAMNDFLAMFGEDESSYPADFPMSLRV